MANCIADTHAVIWYLSASPELSTGAKTFIDSTLISDQVLIPSISIIEIIYLTEKNRLPSNTLTALLQKVNLPNSGLAFLDIDVNVALAVQQIPRSLVPDMPDRIIAAMALGLGLPLVTKDQSIRSVTSIKTVW